MIMPVRRQVWNLGIDRESTNRSQYGAKWKAYWGCVCQLLRVDKSEVQMYVDPSKAHNMYGKGP